MSDIARIYVPLIPIIFRLENDFVQPWLKGLRPRCSRPTGSTSTSTSSCKNGQDSSEC
jgi:hypothetical protein